VIPIEEYLTSTYEPDCDYVDGRIEERNWGEWPHARLQARLGALLHTRAPFGTEVLIALRIRVSASRIRIADICVAASDSEEPIPTTPPLLCIEILSPEDRITQIEIKITDYLQMGVAYVWVLDPQTKQAYVATAADGLREVKTGVLVTANPTFEVPLSEIFR
jgi:Uma2 family endonuclease